MRWWRALAGFLVFSLWPSSSAAVEYRLRVANVEETAYFHFAEADGRQPDSPFLLERLRSVLDRAELPSGVFVSRRALLPANAALARAFDTGAIRPAGEAREEGQWEEVRWEGRPGDRVVWVVQGQGVHLQEVIGVGLAGNGAGLFRHHIPYGASFTATATRALRFPLALIEFWEGKSDLWTRWLSRYLDLRQGLAAVVAENQNPVFADSVFLVIQQPAAPTTYSAVVGWRKREPHHRNQWESVGGGSDPTAK